MDYNYVNYLVSKTRRTGGTVFLEQYLESIESQIGQGLGRSLVTTTVNGKTMSFTINKSPEELAVLVDKAIQIYYRGYSATIGFSFTRLRI